VFLEHSGVEIGTTDYVNAFAGNGVYFAAIEIHYERSAWNSWVKLTIYFILIEIGKWRKQTENLVWLEP